MDRRLFLKAAAGLPALLTGCRFTETAQSLQIMTVNGWLDTSQMGLTLSHEHLYADVRPADEQRATPFTPDIDAVVDVVLPHLQRIRALGCRTLVDATATGVGRNPAIVARLSAESGLNMLMPSGAYLAADGIFMPGFVATDTPENLASRWIDEWQNGIDGTGIRPGFLKLGVNGGPLTELEAKIIGAAAITHLETGLAIAVHTSPWSAVEPGHNARSAREQLETLKAAGVSPSAWIWVHAQNEQQRDQHLAAARQGAYISFDGYRPGQEADYLAMIGNMRDAGLLNRVLLSQDAGWYSAAEERGGNFSPFEPILTGLIPSLSRAGYTQAEIDTLFIDNPAAAFSVRVQRV